MVNHHEANHHLGEYVVGTCSRHRTSESKFPKHQSAKEREAVWFSAIFWVPDMKGVFIDTQLRGWLDVPLPTYPSGKSLCSGCLWVIPKNPIREQRADGQIQAHGLLNFFEKQVDIQKITFPAKNHVPVTEATWFVVFVKGTKKLPEIMGSLDNIY